MTATAAVAVIAGIGGIDGALSPRMVTATGDLATAAGRAALDSAGTCVADLLILATSSPDLHRQATAPQVASRLGLSGIGAYDAAAGCSGFIHALAAATEAIAAGGVRSVLVIGADACLNNVDIPDSPDRGVAARFGDGEGTGNAAGAVLLRRGRAHEPGAILGTDPGGAGIRAHLFAIEMGGSSHAHAVRRMTASARATLYRAGWMPGELDAFVAQYADQRIVDTVADRLGVREGHRVSNPGQVGDTAAAAVPLALADAVGRGVVPLGGRALLTAFGAGPAWGSAAIRWPDVRPVYAELDRSPAYTDIAYVSATHVEPAPKEAAYAHADYFSAEWGRV